MTPGLVFDPERHTYELDGVRLPSVTGVLKSAGLLDFSRIPPSYLAEARERGTLVHSAIQFYNENDLSVAAFCEDYPEYAGYLRGWIAFREQRHFVPMLNEHRVASRRHRVAGTLDCLGLLDGRAVLLDYKTGRPDDVAADLQTAAYFGLAVEWATEDLALAVFFEQHPAIRRYAVQLLRDGTFRVEAFDAPTDYREFLTLVDARRVVEKRRGAHAWIAAEVA